MQPSITIVGTAHDGRVAYKTIQQIDGVPTCLPGLMMPASQMGLGNFFLERSITMQGYQIGSPPSPQQLPSHMNALHGLPLSYSGLPGYNFIPYPQARRMVNSFDLKAASPYHHTVLNRGSFYSPYHTMVQDDPCRTNKVASRESTSALKAWLNEHLKNPYPTKGEKIMLAIVSKMSLTQVSTWFANARRRLKKENRVSWASKGKSDEEEEGESEEESLMQKDASSVSEDEDEIDLEAVDEEEKYRESVAGCPSRPVNNERLPQTVEQPKDNDNSVDGFVEGEQGPVEVIKDSKVADSVQKPKIWSLAEIATSQTVIKTEASHTNARSEVDVGKWWLNWASRNGLYIPANYDFLKQDSGCQVNV